jgi:hypothetical protein
MAPDSAGWVALAGRAVVERFAKAIQDKDFDG